MKKIILLAFALAAWGQQVTISDTLTSAIGGAAWTGRIEVSILAPGSAQPLYYSTTSLAGWQYILCVGVTGDKCSATTAAGVVTIPLYANSTITPAGTSYSARYAPAKGTAWAETWVVGASDTKLYQIRATTVPTPTTTFAPSQLSGGGASNGECLIFNGTSWDGAACASGGGSGTVTSVALALPNIFSVSGSPVTSSGTLTGTLAAQTANYLLAGPTTGAAAAPAFRALVSADIPANAANTSGNAGTATALAVNGTNCSAGSYALGVDASGNAEGCTVASGGGGTVTSVSVVTANGLAGTVANATTTPAITLTTSITGVLKGNGTAISAASAGTDYVVPAGNVATATALAANGANCSAGSFPLGVDTSGAAETCTALPTTITGTANQITASASTGSITLSIPTNPTLPGTTTGTFSGNLTGNVTGNVSGSAGSATGNAGTATALAADPTDCSANQPAIGITAAGTANCATLTATVVKATSGVLSAATAGTDYVIPSGSVATLTTPRTIAGVSFDGSANIAIASTGLSDTANLVRNNAANTWSTGAQVFTAASLRIPNSTTLPGTCTVGDVYFDTDATAGQNQYGCTATNTWTLQGDGGGGGGGTVTSVGFTGGLISVANPTTTPAFTVAGTSGGIPYFSAASTWASSAALASTGLVIGGGAGAAPTSTAALTYASNLLTISNNVAGGTGIVITNPNTAVNAQSYICISNDGCSIGNLVFGMYGTSYTTSGGFVQDGAYISAATGVSGGLSILARATNTDIRFYTSGSADANRRMFIGGTNGNVNIGQTASTNNLASLSLGVFDTTATTGATRAIVQAGAGQSTTNLTEWRANNATLGSGTLGFAIAGDTIPQWASVAEPTCNSSNRGKVTMVQGGAGVADTLRVCRKDAADAYAWTALY